MKRSDLELLGIAAALLAAALMLSGCKTTSSSESHMAASAAETLDATAHTETHVEEAPSKITTITEEYGPPQAEVSPVSSAPLVLLQGQVGEGRDPRAEAQHPAQATAGPLLRRTVTIAEIGKKTTDTEADIAAKLREEARLKAEAQQSHTFDFLHGNLVMIGAAVVLVAAAGTALWLWRRRKAIAAKAIAAVLP